MSFVLTGRVQPGKGDASRWLGWRERADPWVIEIVAPVGLRATYGLRDGDAVTVEVLARWPLPEPPASALAG